MYLVAREVSLNRTRMAAFCLALGTSDLEYVQAYLKTYLHHVYYERELSTDLT
jgi:hypothetical protein